MKRIITQILPILAFIFSMSFAAMAQTKVAGNVRDAASKEALIGVSISVKGKVIGTISDVKGNIIFLIVNLKFLKYSKLNQTNLEFNANKIPNWIR